MTNVSIARKGQTYSGTYSVKGNILTVAHEGQVKRTQIGDTPPAVLAEMILGEMIELDTA